MAACLVLSNFSFDSPAATQLHPALIGVDSGDRLLCIRYNTERTRRLKVYEDRGYMRLIKKVLLAYKGSRASGLFAIISDKNKDTSSEKFAREPLLLETLTLMTDDDSNFWAYLIFSVIASKKNVHHKPRNNPQKDSDVNF